MYITKDGNVMNVTRAIYKDIYQPKGWKIKEDPETFQLKRNDAVKVTDSESSLTEKPVRKKVRKNKEETIGVLRSEPNDE